MVGEKRAQLPPPDRELTVSPPLACLDSPYTALPHIFQVLQGRTEHQGNVHPASYKWQKAQTRRREKAVTSVAKKIGFCFSNFLLFHHEEILSRNVKSQILNKCVCKKRGAVQRLFMRCLLSHHRLLLARYQNTGAKNCLSTSLFILSQTGTGKQMKSLSKWKQRGY